MLERKNNLHLLILTPGFPQDEEDTSCLTYLQNYLLALIRSGDDIRITVLSLTYPNTTSQYNWNGINVFPLGIEMKAWRRSTGWLKAYKKILQIHKQDPISIIHSFWLKDCCFIGWLINSNKNIPHICTAMGADVLTVKNKFLRILPIHKIRIISVSNFQNEHLKKVFPNSKSTIIPWGIKTINKPINQNRNIDILNVSSINEGKNLPLFVDSILLLKEKYPSVKAVIIGEDQSHGKLQQLINEKKLRENILFEGKLSNEEVLDKMENAKILLHTSRYESFGYVFIEALRAGMRIVSAKVGIAESSPYWRLAEGTVESFLKEINVLIQDTEEFERRVPFRMEKTIQLYLQEYLKIQ